MFSFSFEVDNSHRVFISFVLLFFSRKKAVKLCLKWNWSLYRQPTILNSFIICTIIIYIFHISKNLITWNFLGCPFLVLLKSNVYILTSGIPLIFLLIKVDLFHKNLETQINKHFFKKLFHRAQFDMQWRCVRVDWNFIRNVFYAGFRSFHWRLLVGIIPIWDEVISSRRKKSIPR